MYQACCCSPIGPIGGVSILLCGSFQTTVKGWQIKDEIHIINGWENELTRKEAKYFSSNESHINFVYAHEYYYALCRFLHDEKDNLYILTK